eukprot:TRINITY_DN3076_c0_g1_i1.p2 TRINITY_DN3076_c0_g1~~TRINITY_DN3076_c0_g1_i1.p2  ORF type:complete len:642 (-),score=55.01 TRINITY_DN3076_c0_g1_i1:177-2102(-)
MASGTSSTPSASLYVGDLDREVTEAQLYELFSQVGPVASIRVCRDALTRRSLGYAYVNYNSAVDERAAERAIEALNYQAVNGRPIRIMWSHRDPSTRRSGVGNIFIKNLDESIDHKALHDTFNAFGNILSCKIATMPDGKSKGYGFVHFESEEGANLAIEKVNGMLLEGKKVFVGKFLKKNERDSDSSQPRFTNCFIKNLDTEVSDDELAAKFREVGPITNAVVMRDEAGKSKGFGFVNYEDPAHAQEAVDKLNNTPLGAKNVFVSRAQKKAEREQLLRKQYEEKKMERLNKSQNTNLYVKNLEEAVDDDLLRAEFAAFGTITSAKVMRDDKGNSRGFGFVNFATSDEAARAILEGNGRMINNRPIYVALAQRKDVRQAQLQQQFAMRLPAGMPAVPGVMPGAVAVGPTGAPLPPGAPGAPPPMFPAGAPMFYAPPGVLPGPGGPQQRQGVVYQPMMPRGGWRGGPMPGGPRPGFQPMPNYNASVGPRQRQGRQRPNMQQQQGQQQQQPQQVMANGMVPAGMPMGAVPVPMVPVPMGAPGVVPAAMPLPSDPLNPTVLAAAPPAQQKQMLGERLFPLIQRHQPELAGKITGMLLEMDNSELLLLLESPDALLAKVEEALMVLRQHSTADGTAAGAEEVAAA